MSRLEQAREQLQAALDGLKTKRERNALGQFATPGPLALEIVRSVQHVQDRKEDIVFVDPAFGTGVFYSALLRVFRSGAVGAARGHEIDPHYGRPARKLWEPAGFELEIGDFTATKPGTPELADLLVCNPPYVRHHHIQPATKSRLAGAVEKDLGIRVSGLAGLYVYYMLLSHKWLNADGLSVWLIPSEFMDVNYGVALKTYLLDRVDLVRIHRFDPGEVQFGDALVSSAVVWFRNRRPEAGCHPEFTFGGSVVEPKTRRRVRRTELRRVAKWTRFPAEATETKVRRPRLDVSLGDFFSIRRGIVTGANHFFVLDEAKAAALPIPSRFLTPVLPSPRRLRADIVTSDRNGCPDLDEKYFLFDCRMSNADLARNEPGVAAYVASGEAANVHKGYLALRRNPWYAQEHRKPAPFLCTYMGRNADGKAPFRVILNRSRAIATNVYLMLYPKSGLSRIAQDFAVQTTVWESLRGIVADAGRAGGRVYGGGLHKVDPGTGPVFRRPACRDVAGIASLRRNAVVAAVGNAPAAAVPTAGSTS